MKLLHHDIIVCRCIILELVNLQILKAGLGSPQKLGSKINSRLWHKVVRDVA